MSVNSMSADKTILVVDDTPSNLQVLFDVLSEHDYRVAIAKNGETALQRIQLSQPDLILLDVMMPGIDGFETCKQLKANPDTRDIPVVFMTALSDSVDKIKGLSLGAVDYITKPIQCEEVLARIQVHLQLRNATGIMEQRTKELNEALENLKQAKTHLVQGEKMSALGHLVAGVAHEINNPVNFIHANLNPVKEYTEYLLDFVQLYQKHYPNPVPEIQTRAEEIDLKFLQSDLVKILNSMKIGTDRIRELVLSLRNFSRLDEGYCKAVDIHVGIDSTLLILQHRLKGGQNCPEIQVIKNYGQLPQVQCYPSQLNQVFMNILSNAIDALESSGVSNNQEPRITIRTFISSDDAIAISIADNGVGIPEPILCLLFDPFFTTKPLGKGTGLGLSISHQIITEKHGGKIECSSILGQSTEFVVKIPVK
ncbi:response regulator [Microcoleus sp. PH2017_30_WIL_O_A]|uniref:hybrid sensor histidine kinase/response regulator n=1 Tax=Microcoleus sp. PH2017_30_WIL_O_A TaxID=2798840 RepID=UPI001DB5BFED|nr:response regulator [Microcoleus sp. PH2017_30_WIL_O_A]MCC3586391.1 hybrid sensor histidine kinase/response regulator [Microcoleus sp. PH2017_30_WIL_O_A]